MKALERRIADLEGLGTSGLWHITDDELRARIVSNLGTLEGEGVALPMGWREADDFTAILANAIDQAKAMVA